MLKNNKGMTLLELLICLVILGILLPVMGQFWAWQAKQIAKVNAAIQQVKALQVPQPAAAAHSQVTFNDVMTNSTFTPIICFDNNGKPNSCTDGKPCSFDAKNGWTQQNKVCSYGVLLVY